jgi:hypothetical protein
MCSVSNSVRSMDATTLKAHYDAMKAEATLLAGDLLDIPRRVVVLFNLYLDSGRNHAFSQIAAHGALWAYGYFEIGGSLGRLIARRYFYNPTERAYRLSLLDEFAEGFRRVNRLVCIDTWTNYTFSKEYGHHSAAGEILPANLLVALNRVHAASKRGQQLSPAEKRQVFEQSFLCEQEVTVAPGVATAVAAFECRVLKFLCLRPLVRFAYFPRCSYLFFRNFADKDERITKGLRAYDHAATMGWEHVQQSMRDYGRMPRRFFEAPEACLADIRAGRAETAAAASAVGNDQRT